MLCDVLGHVPNYARNDVTAQSASWRLAQDSKHLQIDESQTQGPFSHGFDFAGNASTPASATPLVPEIWELSLETNIHVDFGGLCCPLPAVD